jgi:hypothetical protein
MTLIVIATSYLRGDVLGEGTAARLSDCGAVCIGKPEEVDAGMLGRHVADSVFFSHCS